MAHNKLQYDPSHNQTTSLESIVFSETSAVILSSCSGAGSLKPLIYGEVVDELDTKFVGNRKQLENDKTLSDHNIQSVTISFRKVHNTSSTQSKWRSQKSLRRPRRGKEPITQEKIN